MVGTKYFLSNLALLNFVHQSGGHQEVVQSPAYIFGPGEFFSSFPPLRALRSPAAHHVGPKCVSILFVRLKVSEGVNKACLQQVSESVSFLLSEASILLVGFGVLQVNFVVCDIHVATDYDRFLSIQFLNMTPMDGSRLQVFIERR